MSQQFQDDQLLSIRPIIDIEFIENKTAVEQFMHETLRPILKFQHDTIRILIETEKHFNRNQIMTKSQTDARNHIKEFISKNASLKNQLIGAVVGLMTSDEKKFFVENKTDLSKRIIEMVVTRYHSMHL